MSTIENLESQTMRFKVEFVQKHQTIKHIFHAVSLDALEKEVKKQFPGAKIISIIGGGQCLNT